MSAGKQEAWELLVPELPPGCELLELGAGLIPVIKWPALATGWGSGTWPERLDFAWSKFAFVTGIPRDEFTAMKAKADRCDELIALVSDWSYRLHDSVLVDELCNQTVDCPEVNAMAEEMDHALQGGGSNESVNEAAELRARVSELEGRVSELSMDLSNAECDTQEAIANAIDSERDTASDQTPGDWLPDDPHEAYVEGMSQAFVTARDWSSFDAAHQRSAK